MNLKVTGVTDKNKDIKVQFVRSQELYYFFVMKAMISIKGFRLSSKNSESIKKRIQKLSHYLYRFISDLPQVYITIKKGKKHIKHNEPQLFYTMKVELILPKKVLSIEVDKGTVDEVIITSFKNLHRKIAVYKHKHFKGHSDYPSRQKIKDYLQTP